MPSRKQKKALTTTLLEFYNKPVAKVSFNLFLTVAAVLFFAFFAIRPTLITMSDLVKEIQDKNELNTKLDQKIAALSTAQGEYQNIQPRLVVLDEAMPTNPAIVILLKTIEKIASEQQIAIENITLKELPESTDKTVPLENQERKNLVFSVILVGDYPAVKKFVENLQAVRRNIVIESVTFSAADQRGIKSLTTTINAQTYYYGSMNLDLEVYEEMPEENTENNESIPIE